MGEQRTPMDLRTAINVCILMSFYIYVAVAYGGYKCEVNSTIQEPKYMSRTSVRG